MSSYGKNHATGCPFSAKIMPQGTTIDKKIMRQGIMWKDIFSSSLETMDFGKIFMQQGIPLDHFLCGRVQLERFATNPSHFPNQVSPPGGQNTQLGSMKHSLSVRIAHDNIHERNGTKHKVNAGRFSTRFAFVSFILQSL